MNKHSIPDGPDFETALQYLDGELSERDQVLFEVRLSENPELAEQFERLSALDAAQRRLAGNGSLLEDGEAQGLAPLLASTKKHKDHLVFAGVIAVMIGAVIFGWRLVGLQSTRRSEATRFDATNLGGGGTATGAAELELFLVGFPERGTPVRLQPSAGDGNLPSGAFRPAEEGASVDAIAQAIAGNGFAWPASATAMGRLLVGQMPSDSTQFLAALDLRLAGPEEVTEQALRAWLEEELRGARDPEVVMFERVP